jgi:flagellar biosynthesis/type III secretory pathway protein FliH
MTEVPPVERFTFSELTPATGARGPAGPSLAGLSDHQLRKLIGELQDELEQARSEARTLADYARDEGFRNGLEQARGELQASLLSATDCVNDALDSIAADIAGRFETVVRDSAGLAFVVGEHLAAQVLERAPLSVIEGALAAVLSEMHKLTDLEIEVHPSLVEPLQTALRSNNGLGRKISVSVHADQRLIPGDAQISWGEGGLKVDFASRRSALLEALGVILPDDDVTDL